MTEDVHGKLLEAVRGSIGMLVDCDAITDAEHGRMRFKDDWLVVDDTGRPRVRPPAGFEKYRRVRRNSGVLLKTGSDPMGVTYVVTAAHCIPLIYEEIERIRLVVGLGRLEQSFDRSQVIFLGEVKHYENMPDRDLVILTARGIPSEPKISRVSRDVFDAGTRNGGPKVYVIGHAGGRELSAFEGTVTARVPPEPKFGARGVNLEVPGMKHCLSGAPVFLGSDERVTLLGVVQRNDDVDGRIHALVQKIIARDPSRRYEALAAVHDALHYFDLFRRHGMPQFGPAALLRRVCDAHGVSGLELPWHEGSPDMRPTLELAMNKLRGLLGTSFEKSDVEEIEALAIDDCDKFVHAHRLNVTLVHGSPSQEVVPW
jgi:hypothetical protein